MMYLAAYFAMLIFDLAMFGGTAYLIECHGWSVHTFWATTAISMGCAPTSVFRALKGDERSKS